MTEEIIRFAEEKGFNINFKYDSEAEVWYAVCNDIPGYGLVLEDEDFDNLCRRMGALAEEALENPAKVVSGREVPAIDEGEDAYDPEKFEKAGKPFPFVYKAYIERTDSRMSIEEAAKLLIKLYDEEYILPDDVNREPLDTEKLFSGSAKDRAENWIYLGDLYDYEITQSSGDDKKTSALLKIVRECYRMAAELGSTDGLIALGNTYENDEEYEEAMMLYEEAGDKGDALGYKYLYDLYIDGNYVDADLDKAEEYLDKIEALDGCYSAEDCKRLREELKEMKARVLPKKDYTPSIREAALWWLEHDRNENYTEGYTEEELENALKRM